MGDQNWSVVEVQLGFKLLIKKASFQRVPSSI